MTKNIVIPIDSKQKEKLKDFCRREGYVLGFWARKVLLKEAGIIDDPGEVKA